MKEGCAVTSAGYVYIGLIIGFVIGYLNGKGK